MGLKNAPGEFQRVMENCLDGLRDDICIPYIDDIVFSQTFRDVMLLSLVLTANDNDSNLVILNAVV